MIPVNDILTSELPAGWRTVPFWSLFRRHKKTGFPHEELLSVYRDYGVIPKSSRDDNHNKESEELSGYQLVTNGALVTNKMKAWQGSIAISRYRGIVSPAYYVYTPQSKECDQFLHYLLRSDPYIGLYRRISKGVRVNQWDLEHEALRTVPVLLPDLATQRQIADFLDRETARIDSLIDKKQRLLVLLNEKLQNEISALVVDPSSDRIVRLRYLVTLNPSVRDQKFSSDVLVTFCPMEAIDGGVGGIDPSATRQFSELRFGSYNYFREGDILLAKVTPCFENGKKGLARNLQNATGFATSEVFVIRANPLRISPEFLIYLFSSHEFQSAGRSSMTGAGGLKRISEQSILDFPLTVTDLAHQESIVRKIDIKVRAHHKLVDAATASIDHLKDYRSALIAAAVTGQIAVTTYAKPGLPDRHLNRMKA